MKKFLVLLLALALVVSLVACGEKKKDKDDDDDEETTEATSETGKGDKDDKDSNNDDEAEDVALKFMKKLYGNSSSASEKYCLFTYEEKVAYAALENGMDVDEYLEEYGFDSVDEYISAFDEELESVPAAFEEEYGVEFDPEYEVEDVMDADEDDIDAFCDLLDEGEEEGYWDMTSDDVEDAKIVTVVCIIEDADVEEADDVVLVKYDGEWKVVAIS